MTPYDYTSAIRNLTNAPWKQAELLKSRGRWLQLCSSLDAIGDTGLAVDAYMEGGFPKGEGARYLAIYGLLQALYIQQDAVADLCKALQSKAVTISPDWREYPAIRTVRDIRNKAVGHPTEAGRKAPYSYQFISRVTLTQAGFDFHSAWGDGKEEWHSVSVEGRVKDQKQSFSHILELLVDELHNETAAHRQKFKEEEMVNVFPASLPYAFQNLLQASRAEPDLARVGMAKAALQQIDGVLRAFSEAAAARGLTEALHLNWTYEEHALGVLNTYLDQLLAHQEPLADHRTAYIFAVFLESQISHLRETAKEIDEDLAT